MGTVKLPTENVLPQYYFEASNDELTQRIIEAKKSLGDKLLILSHHYQKDEVVKFADETGDSLQLAQIASKNKKAEYIVFCGVHFMAETADMLTEDFQKIILPDLDAGCTMADMVEYKDLEVAWDKLTDVFGEILPLTYINSTAAVKAFVGKHGGATVTSGNAEKIITWALDKGKRVLFVPDQHLGRNVSNSLGIKLEEMATWNFISNKLEYDNDLENCKVILWDGYCAVHQQFTPEHVVMMRKNHPNINIIVHSECSHDVVKLSDSHGSTNNILNAVENAAPGTSWAIGTDNNLVNRIIAKYPDKDIYSLNPISCPCATMNRIELPHLAWAIDNILNSNIKNQIVVEDKVKVPALKALDKMLSLS
ncbi:MAG: quinolinate synthase NadA [Clostridioides difficile]|nr:quinolinate synthase NadA [Clostridioides sp.]MBS5787011.1 quinolinate synthase NadA [Clostridioides difficile]